MDGLDGVRGITLSNDGQYAYSSSTADDAVSWFERNATTGALTYQGMVKDGVGGVDGLNFAYAPSFLWMVNMHTLHGYFDKSVSWYERNASTGALSYEGILKNGVGGVDGLNGAKDLRLSRREGPLRNRNQDDAVNWFTRDPLTGALSYGSASGANYTLTAADAGSVITVIASYTDGGGSPEQAPRIYFFGHRFHSQNNSINCLESGIFLWNMVLQISPLVLLQVRVCPSLMKVVIPPLPDRE